MTKFLLPTRGKVIIWFVVTALATPVRVILRYNLPPVGGYLAYIFDGVVHIIVSLPVVSWIYYFTYLGLNQLGSFLTARFIDETKWSGAILILAVTLLYTYLLTSLLYYLFFRFVGRQFVR